MPIAYLELEDVVGYYADLFGCSDQQAADQLRYPEGLEAAVVRPRTYASMDADLALQAAILAHGIAEGQVFVEGNKRIALISMLAFLALNGFTVSATQEERFRWMIRMARPEPASAEETPTERASAEEIAADVRACLIPIAPPPSL